MEGNRQELRENVTYSFAAPQWPPPWIHAVDTKFGPHHLPPQQKFRFIRLGYVFLTRLVNGGCLSYQILSFNSNQSVHSPLTPLIKRTAAHWFSHHTGWKTLESLRVWKSLEISSFRNAQTSLSGTASATRSQSLRSLFFSLLELLYMILCHTWVSGYSHKQAGVIEFLENVHPHLPACYLHLSFLSWHLAIYLGMFPTPEDQRV